MLKSDFLVSMLSLIFINRVSFTPLGLSFLIYKVGVGIIVSHGVWVRIK